MLLELLHGLFAIPFGGVPREGESLDILAGRSLVGVPDVGLFDATGALNTPGSLPAGERVTLPFFGKSPVAERQSARGYAPARSRADRESARAQRSARMSSRRSSRGSARSSARSSARGGGYVPAAAGPKHGRRSSWEQRDGFVVHPRFRSRSEMMEFRRESMMPHHTFDVDGDGVVSSEDFKLAQAFDINKDGGIDREEWKKAGKNPRKPCDGEWMVDEKCEL